jgi:hypothetical protein
MQRLTSIFFVVFFLIISSAHAQLQQCPGGWVTDAGILKCRCSDGSFADLTSGDPVCNKAPAGILLVPEPDEQLAVAPLPYPKLGLRIGPAPDGRIGVLINEVVPDSEADAKGIRAGSIITSVHMAAVTNPADVIANVERAYRDGRGAVMMRIDEQFVAIPFSDRKGQRLAQREAAPVLRAEPQPARRPAPKTEPDPDQMTRRPIVQQNPVVEATSTLPLSGNWLPIILALITGALAAPHLARGYRLAASRWHAPAVVAGTTAAMAHVTSREALVAPIARTSMLNRDTGRALQAMRLAFAYLDELRAAGPPDPENASDRKSRLNTLSLATKQLDYAERLDPDAVLEGDGERGARYRLSLNQLKVLALTAEAITQRHYDIRRALPPLITATRLDPHDDMAFYLLGSIHLSNKNRAAAITALTRAVELNPNEIDYRKELDRAQNMSAIEVAGYKASRAGEHALTGGYIIWIILKILFFPVVICIEAFRFAARHSSSYR